MESGTKEESVKLSQFDGLLRKRNMTDMNGIKRSAKKTDSRRG